MCIPEYLNSNEYEFYNNSTIDIALQENNNEREIEEKESNINKNYITKGLITIKNDTSNSIDIDEIKERKLSFTIKSKKVSAIIYHTHTSEAYTPTKKIIIYQQIHLEPTIPNTIL
jgi:hypothetical protein